MMALHTDPDTTSTEWDAVTSNIFENKNSYTGVSLLPASGDQDYEQAPFTTALTPRELVEEFGTAAFFASGLIVDLKRAFGSLHAACDSLKYGVSFPTDDDTDHCELEKLSQQQVGMGRIHKFSKKYFDGDEARVVACLKACDTLHQYETLMREIRGRKIDWGQFKIDATDHGARERRRNCPGRMLRWLLCT